MKIQKKLQIRCINEWCNVEHYILEKNLTPRQVIDNCQQRIRLYDAN